MADNPEYLLFSQHGWADNNLKMLRLAQAGARPNTHIIAPSLSFIGTWIRIEPLIKDVEKIVAQALDTFPHARVQAVGHSMGGLIWLELLARHPNWLARMDQLIVLASPIGGNNLTRMVDPIGLGLGIARDLSVSRRKLAEELAEYIPLVSIAGDIHCRGDGAVTVESTQFRGGRHYYIPGARHANIMAHPKVVPIVQRMLAGRTPTCLEPYDLIDELRHIPGMTDGHRWDFCKADIDCLFEDGHILLKWQNRLRMQHVFVANADGHCLFAGYVGFPDRRHLEATLDRIKAKYQAMLI